MANDRSKKLQNRAERNGMETDTAKATEEESKGLVAKVVDFLICVVLIWFMFNAYNRDHGKKVSVRSPVNNVTTKIPRKPAQQISLPAPPPSPPSQQQMRDPSPTYYDQYENLIFIGGLPGSGVSLMRAVLDAHPEVRCGNGRDIIYRVISSWRTVAYNKHLMERMRLAGVNERVVDIAMIVFLLEILVNNGPPAARLCTSDPLSIFGGRYLLHIFPNVKMVFLIRDLRAVAYSIFRRKMKIDGKIMKNIEKAARILEPVMTTMRKECHLMGVDRCLPVRYEELVLKPRETMEKVLKFLDIPWKEQVLHHYYYAGKTGVFIDPRSNDTVPIYDSSLTSWVGEFPSYITDFPSFYLKHLEFLGYDPQAFPPDYSRLPGYNWTKPEEPTPIMRHDSTEFLRLVAKVAAEASGIDVEKPPSRK